MTGNYKHALENWSAQFAQGCGVLPREFWLSAAMHGGVSIINRAALELLTLAA